MAQVGSKHLLLSSSLGLGLLEAISKHSAGFQSFSEVLHYYTPAENTHNKQCNRSKTLDFYLQAGNLYVSLKLDLSVVLFSFFRTLPEAKKMIILHEILTFIRVNSLFKKKKKNSSSMPSNYSKALSMVFLYPQGQPSADPPCGGYI